MKIKEFLYEKEQGRGLLAGLLLLVVFFVIYTFSTVRFSTNDDNTIINSLIYSSGQTGLEGQSFMYINFLLGLPLSRLYRICGSVPWYEVYQVGIQAVSLFVIWKHVLRECYRSKIGLLPASLIVGVLQGLLLTIPIQQVQFTTTAGVVGCAGIVSYLCQDKSKAFRVIQFVPVWIFTLLCFFQREMVGYVILAFLYLLIFMDLAESWIQKKSWKEEKKKVFCSIFLLLSIFAAISLNEKFNNQQIESQEFQEYSSLRVQYMDYNSGAFLSNPQIFEEVGWDPELCAMVSEWYFMDERYNTETLKTILEQLNTGTEKENAESTFQDAWPIWKDLMQDHTVKILIAFTVCLVLLYVFSQGLGCKNRYFSHATVLLLLAGSFLLALYLCLRGRFPLRVFQVISIPVNLLLAVFIIRSVGMEKDQKQKRWKQGIRLIVFVCILFLCMPMAKGLFNRDTQTAARGNREELIAMKEYAGMRQDNVYVYGSDLTGGEPIFYRTGDNTVYNCFFWGGTSMFSKAFYENLTKCGLEHLQTEDWFRENVYYLVKNEEKKAILYKYLSTRYEDVVMEQRDSIGNIQVIKFTRNAGE